MSYIYKMVEDGSYVDFKKAYENADQSNHVKFKFNNEDIDTTYAKYVCIFVDTYLQDLYEEYLSDQIDAYVDCDRGEYYEH